MDYIPVSKRTGVSTSPFTYTPVDERTPTAQATATKAGVPLVNRVLGRIEGLTARPAEGSTREQTLRGQLPSAIAESLPLGIGGIIRTAREEPEVISDVKGTDILKGIAQTAKDYILKYPLIVASNLAGVPVKFNIPGLGEITNRQFNAAERIRQGEDTTEVLLSEGSGAIFDTLFLLGLTQKVFGGRPTTIAKGEAPQGITVTKPPKTGRLYQEPTGTQPLSPEFMQRMATEQGITIKNYNPKLPTYFRMTGKATGKITGEVVQIKPSYFDTFISKLKGDATKVPQSEIIPIASKETSIKALEQAKPTTTIVPPVPPVPPAVPKVPQMIVPPVKPVETIVKPAEKPKEYIPVEQRISEGKEVELDPLLSEARKYKSAEEFVKAQGTPKLYNVGDSFGMGKIIENPFKEGVPSVEKAQEINKYLQANKDKYNPKYIKFYHGTAKGLPIEKKGLLPTSATRRKSYQSESGYVYLANTPERAKTFGDLGNMSKSDVYEVVVPVDKLMADLDQLNNIRSTGEKVGNTVGESIVYGGGVRIKGKIEPYAIRKLPDDFKTKSQLTDIWKKANEVKIEKKPSVPKEKEPYQKKSVPTKERFHQPIRRAGNLAVKVPTAKTIYDKTRILKGTYKGKPYTTDGYMLEFEDVKDLPLVADKEAPTSDAIQEIIVDRTAKNDKTITYPVGYKNKFGTKEVFDAKSAALVFKVGNEFILLDPKYYNYFSKKYPQARFVAGTPTDPIRVYDGSEFKGVVMPISSQGGIRNVYTLEGKPLEDKIFSQKGGGGGEVEADIGAFADGTPIKAGHLDKVQPIEMPELVDITRELMGIPKIKQKLGKKLGLFRPRGKGTIELKASIFQDPIQAAKVLAHEIGHLVDYLPDRIMKRGNLLGHLLTLSNFRKNTFEDIIASNSKLRQELIDVSNYWRPSFDPKGTDSFSIYRKSAKELYADALSMLLNSPGLLEEKAPTFYKEFFAQLDKKPQVRDAYFDLQARLNGDRQTLINARREGVRGMFKEGDYKAWELQAAREAEKKARDRNLLFKFKYEMIDKNQALIDRVNKAQKEGKIIPDDENPLYYLEERNYVGGKQKALMERYFSPIYKNLKDAGITWTDFGEVMFYRRIVSGDRSEQANPRGITPDAAKELLQDIENNFTEEQLKTITDSLEKFREGMMKVNEEAYNEGMYTPELYKQMQENPDYASFRVIDHLEDNVTSKIYKSIGTLKDITNPADASIMKTLAVLRAVEYQKTKRSAVDFLLKNNPEDIKEAQTRWTGKHKEFIESKKEREELVMLYSKVNKGKMEGYYVDPYIKTSLTNESVGSNNLIIGSMKALNSNLFRPLYIGFNPGFQAFNLMRDFLRFWKNIPGMTLGKALRQYKAAYRASRVRAFGAKPDIREGVDVFSKAELDAVETIIEMEEKQILSVTFNDLVNGENVEDIQLHTILKRSGIDSFTTPKKVPMLMKPIFTTLDFIKKTGDLIETLPKVAGYYEFTGNRSKPISKEDASFIRKNIGSPDFLAGGHLKPATNEVFLFSNAITQGLRADYNVATNPRTRSGYWWKTAKMNFVPKLLMYLAILGVFGETVRKIMEGASEYDKTNYTIVPIGLNEEGKSIYIRIPQDETGRLLGGLTWKILTAANNQQNIAKDAVDLVSFTGGQLPSLNPIIQDISAVTQFLSGQNPYDFFRNREVLSDDVYKAGGAEAFKQFAGWMWNQNGGGIFNRFYTEPSVPQPKGTAEKVFNLPVLGNIAGRFVRISDYGVKEKLTEVKQEASSEDARRRIDERQFVNEYIEKYQNGEGTENELLSKMIKDKFPNGIKSEADNEARDRIIARFKVSIKKGYADSNVRAVFDAVSNNEKQAIIIYLKDTLSEEEYDNFKREALKNKATTPEVFYEAEHKE